MPMDTYCSILNCKTGYRSQRIVTKKMQLDLHLFKAPANKALLQLWQSAIPKSDKPLTSNNAVCSLHFKEEDMLKYYETLMPDGTVHKIKRGRVTLKEGSIPCLFPDFPSISSNSEKSMDVIMDLTRETTKSPTRSSIEEYRTGQQSNILEILTIPELHSDILSCNSQKLIDADLPSEQQPELTYTIIAQQPFKQSIFEELKRNLYSINIPNAKWSGTFLVGENVLIFTEWDEIFQAIKRIILNSDLTYKILFGNIQVVIEDGGASIENESDFEVLLATVNKFNICEGIKVYSSSDKCAGVMPLADLNQNKKITNKCFHCCVDDRRVKDYTMKAFKYKHVKSALFNTSRKYATLQSKIKQIKLAMETNKRRKSSLPNDTFIAITKALQAIYEENPPIKNTPFIKLENIQNCRLCGEVTSDIKNIFSEEESSINLMHLINLHLPIRVTPFDGLSPWSCTTCINKLLAFDQMVTTCADLNSCLGAEAEIAINEVIISNETSENTTGLESQESNESTKKRRRNKVEMSFQCPICEKLYPRNCDLVQHLHSAHHIEKTVSDEKKKRTEIIQRCKSVSDEKITYTCDVCVKVFPSRSSLLRHYAIHSNTRNYCCHVCGLRFRVYFTLSNHIKACHQNAKEFKCEICGQGFVVKARMDKHMTIHTQNSRFVCNICGKVFRQRRNFLVHTEKAHVDDAKLKFACKVCGKKYAAQSQLKGHTKVHTGVKPFKCTACDTLFRCRTDLRQHLRNKECNSY